MNAADSLRCAVVQPPLTSSQVLERLESLDRWVRSHDYQAWDPGDGQMSYLARFTGGSLTLERLLTASVLRTPFNVRPLLGIRPHCSTKGMGYMAWGYTRLYRLLRRQEHAEAAQRCLEWLLANRSPGRPGMCWGNAFTFTTRAGRIPKGEPTIVWSALIGQAFVEAFEVFGEQRWLDVATSTCDWICTLPRQTTAHGDCLSYVPYGQVSIHNSNMLGGALLARVGAIHGRDDFLDLAQRSMLYSCSRQNDDGAWYYGDATKYHWIDNFHTGYNLDSLRRYQDSSGDRTFADALTRGFTYFRDHFVEPDGRPRYMHDRRLPTDIQCAAQSIDTLAYFADRDPRSLELSCLVAAWSLAHMQSPQGHFYYRDLGYMKIKTPMFHWGQATMFKALAHLAQRMHGAGAGPRTATST